MATETIPSQKIDGKRARIIVIAAFRVLEETPEPPFTILGSVLLVLRIP